MLRMRGEQRKTCRKPHTHSRGATVGRDGDGEVGAVDEARVVIVDVRGQRELGKGHRGDTGLGAVETADAATGSARLDVLLGKVTLSAGPEPSGRPRVRDRDLARSLRGQLPASLGSVTARHTIGCVPSVHRWPNSKWAIVVDGEGAGEGLAREERGGEDGKGWREVHGAGCLQGTEEI